MIDNKRKSKVVHFRISSQQYERLLNMVQAKGHSNISDYLRFAALEKDLLFETKFNEMHDMMKNIKKKMEKESIGKNSQESYLIN